MLTRRRLLFTGALAGISAPLYPIFIEPRWLELTRTSLSLTPRGLQTIRLLQLTDLHASWAVPMSLIESAIKIGLAQQPDLVCLTGDFITFQSDYDAHAYISALKRLSAYKPTFAVLGNHDSGVWAEQPCRFLNRNGPVVLLSHNPDSKEMLQPFAWDLMLCGHTHGGQVIIPFQGPRFAPVRDKRFVAGLRHWQGRQIYVSRGVGNLGSVRFLCRPEVTLLDVAVA